MPVAIIEIIIVDQLSGIIPKNFDIGLMQVKNKNPIFKIIIILVENRIIVLITKFYDDCLKFILLYCMQYLNYDHRI